jgi:hypothetical protein
VTLQSIRTQLSQLSNQLQQEIMKTPGKQSPRMSNLVLIRHRLDQIVADIDGMRNREATGSPYEPAPQKRLPVKLPGGKVPRRGPYEC